MKVYVLTTVVTIKELYLSHLKYIIYLHIKKSVCNFVIAQYMLLYVIYKWLTVGKFIVRNEFNLTSFLCNKSPYIELPFYFNLHKW